ncbi:hypothetical protein IWQ60_005971 [Tieghemiomyces parasiticus]|uniref:Putative lipoate-protein ligase A n=1 Tax=Tieghemiomyces parasiticus TaxID=78921 RepID=A0A9W8DY05_9FUNG|nr:hypothetical protein IWQ60_005971 [Tieghemiomyces parasiticus]
MQDRDIWLVRRQSGGGTVYHDRGNSLYTVFMPRKDFTRRASAALVTRSLHMLDIPASVNERNDIVIGSCKISGSAYKIIGKNAYHHGTMLISSNLNELADCLRSPRTNIESKGVDSVRSPVTKLVDYSLTVDHDAFCTAVTDEFYRTYNPEAEQRRPIVIDATTALANRHIVEYRDKLKSWEWIFGQTPEFTNTVRCEQPWLKASLVIRVRHGLVQTAHWNIEVGTEVLQAVLRRVADALVGARHEPSDLSEIVSRTLLEQQTPSLTSASPQTTDLLKLITEQL